MRRLLTGILILLPFNAQGEILSVLSVTECDSEPSPESAAPRMRRPEMNDRSRLSSLLHEPGSLKSIYGCFDHPLYPDSNHSRTDTDHPVTKEETWDAAKSA